MVRVSIRYDDELKEQVFMVRGDEDYARSTKTILELGNPIDDELSFDIDASVNVLRDKGDGVIHIYDNDELVYVIDNWNSLNNGVTVRLTGLNYGIDHNIYAKYMGNKSCSPSSSKIFTVNEIDPHKVESIIWLNPTVQYASNTTITKTITLSNEHSATYNQGQVFTVRYDDVLIGNTSPTNSNGVTTINIPTGNPGLHTITVEYVGSNNLVAKTVTQQISVGYNVEFTNYPNYVIAYEEYLVTALITDYFGNPHTPSTDKVVLKAYTDKSPYMPTYECSINSGVVSSILPVDDGRMNHIEIIYTEGNQIYSETVVTNYINPTSDTIIASISENIVAGKSNLLKVQTSPVYVKLPIQLSGTTTGTIYTNGNGTASKVINANGKGTREVTVSLGNVSKTLTYEDYIQYWVPGKIKPLPEQYNLIRGDLLKLNNYFRIDLNRQHSECRFTLPVPENKPFRLIMDGVTTNVPCLCFLAYGNDTKGDDVQNIQYTNATIEIIRDSQNEVILYIRNGEYSSQTEVEYSGNSIGVTIGNMNLNNQVQWIFKSLYYYEE